MDLQYQRNLEQLGRLLGHWPLVAAEKVEYRQPPYGLLVEWREGRVVISSWLLKVPAAPLDTVLKRWHPQRFGGVPQRFYIVKNQLMVSAAMPPGSEAHDWCQICLAQRRMLALVGGI